MISWVRCGLEMRKLGSVIIETKLGWNEKVVDIFVEVRPSGIDISGRTYSALSSPFYTLFFMR